MGAKPTLTERVANIETALAGASLKPKTTVREWIKKHWIMTLVAGATVAAPIIGYFAWLQPQWKERQDRELRHEISDLVQGAFKDHHFDEMKTTVDKMDGRMVEISGYLQILVQEHLKRLSSLSPQEFQHDLPELKTVLDAARAANVSGPDHAVGEIGSKLAQANQNEPQFWAAASALINFRSVKGLTELPACLQNPPIMRLAEPVEAGQSYMKVTPPVYEDCQIDLGARVPIQISSSIHNIAVDHLDFRRCRITYEGGDIPLLAITPKLTFAECAFYVSAPTAPPIKGREFVGRLLSTGTLSHVYFDSSGT